MTEPSNDKKAEDALTDLLLEYAQKTIEVMAADEILTHIPVVKTVAAAAKVAIGVRDQLLTQKIIVFLTALADVPADQRRQMIDRLAADPAYNRNIGTHLIELIDRVESRRKPAMIGAAFAAYSRGEIDATMLQRLNDAVERLPLIEIDSVRKIASQTTPILPDMGYDEVSLQVLTNCGLTTAQSGWGSLVYKPTAICAAFLRLELDRKR